jgi:hypothetical protein
MCSERFTDQTTFFGDCTILVEEICHAAMPLYLYQDNNQPDHKTLETKHRLVNHRATTVLITTANVFPCSQQ